MSYRDDEIKPVRTPNVVREAQRGLTDYRSLGSHRVEPAVEPSADDERVGGTIAGSLKDLFG